VRRPPGPSTLATVRRLRSDRHHGLAAIAREYGDVAYIRAGPTGFYLLSHPDLVNGVLVTNDDRFERVPGERRFSRWVVRDAIFASEGELHARQRALIDPIMYGDAPAAQANDMVDFAARMADSWEAGETIELLDRHERMTTALMVKIMFGADGPEGEAIASALLEAIAASSSIPLAPTPIPNRLPLPSKRRFRRKLAELHRLIDESVERRDGSGEPANNVLSMLRAARDEGGRGMGPEQARDEAISLYRGQKVGVATALTWTWYLLSQHPEAEARFHQEIDSVLGDRPATADDVSRLPYALAAFREAIRIYPPSWVLARKAVGAHPAGDYEIPAGANVLVSQWLNHRDPRFWSEPERFDPERFAAGFPDVPPCTYFPQGAGPKRCPGMKLLPIEAVMVLATVGRKWRLRLASDHRVVPEATVFLQPRGGLPMVPEPRGAS
jgi:cytochrome P450